jgi:hydroxymethylbilane synthase
VKDSVNGAAESADQLGVELASRLRQMGAQEILDEIFAQIQRSERF